MKGEASQLVKYEGSYMHYSKKSTIWVSFEIKNGLGKPVWQ